MTDDRSLTLGGMSYERQWYWNPDAKLVPTRSGDYVMVNYLNASRFTLSPEDGQEVAAVSGLSIPFTIPKAISPELAMTLIERRFLIPQDEFSAYEASTRELIAAVLKKCHGLIIMPTEKCNFRCTYCYESFERGRMSPRAAEAVSKAIKRIARTAGSFSLGFFGGEPLICHDLVRRFSSEAFEILQNRNLPYAASISTNGALLTPARFEQLIDVGVVSYQISVDGPRDLHDTRRITIKGDGTFDRIVENLTAMAETEVPFSCVIRCNSHERDYNQLLSLFLEQELSFVRNDPRFTVDLQRIWESNRREIRPQRDTSCMSQLIKHLDYYTLNRHLEEMGINTIPYSRMPTILGNACYAGKPNWFIIGPNLTLYKCTVAFDNEKNKVGKVTLDGTLVVDESKNQLWTESNALTDSGCSGCHYKIPCGGIACPLTRFTSGAKTCPTIRMPSELQQWSNELPKRSQLSELPVLD